MSLKRMEELSRMARTLDGLPSTKMTVRDLAFVSCQKQKCVGYTLINAVPNLVVFVA